jgi:hypothetical protein
LTRGCHAAAGPPITRAYEPDPESPRRRPPDRAGHADQERQMEEHAAIMAAAFKSYESLIVNDQDRALLESAKANWAAYMEASSPFLALSRDFKAKAAYGVLKAEVGPLVEEQLEQLVERFKLAV